MGSPVHFPDANTITQYLTNHPHLNIGYYQEKGITKAIAELAAKRFANKNTIEIQVKVEVGALVYDLLRGKDGYTGEVLPNFEKIEWPQGLWNPLSTATINALLECAKKVQ